MIPMDLPSTIHSPDKFKANLPAGFDGVFHWGYLIDPIQKATGRKITPMDIDYHVEIGGHFLMMETKDEGVEVSSGQRRALLQHWGKGYATIVFLVGKKDPYQAEIYYPYGTKRHMGGRQEEKEIVTSELIEFVYRWASWANDNPHPFQYAGGY